MAGSVTLHVSARIRDSTLTRAFLSKLGDFTLQGFLAFGSTRRQLLKYNIWKENSCSTNLLYTTVLFNVVTGEANGTE